MATLDEHWGPIEADFQRFYKLDLRYEVAVSGPRRLYALVENLPPAAGLWRIQGRRDPTELMHEWMFTLVQFLAGNKVTTPEMWHGSNGNGGSASKKATKDEVAEFFAKYVNAN